MSNGNGSNGHSAGPRVASGCPDALRSLALHLTDPQERERCAELLTRFRSLPPEDEIRQFMEMLGLWTLTVQQMPDKLTEFLAAFAEYRTELKQCLAKLPEEIAAGVQPEEIAAAMAKSFRQQLAVVGLEQSSALLKHSTAEVKALYGELTKTIKPAVNECKTVASSLSDGVAKILKASSALQAHNTRLRNENEKNSWWLLGLWVLVLVGVVLGMHLSEPQTKAQLMQLETRMERAIEAAAIKPVPPAVKTRRKE